MPAILSQLPPTLATTSRAPLWLLALTPLLKDNGGSTQTHALLSDSAAANAGDTTKLPLDTADRDGDSNTTESIPFDQRGTGFNRVGGSTVDVGAYEVQAASNTAPVVTLAVHL